jgi:hypothetical protein
MAPKYGRVVLQNNIEGACKLSECFAKRDDRCILCNEIIHTPSDRRLRKTTTSKLPSERALNRHKFQETPTTLGR